MVAICQILANNIYTACLQSVYIAESHKSMYVHKNDAGSIKILVNICWIQTVINKISFIFIIYYWLEELFITWHYAKCKLNSITINSLWPKDAIWWHRSRSTLAQVTACCLTALSHYLKQCWLIFSKVQWHSVEGNQTRDSSPFNH